MKKIFLKLMLVTALAAGIITTGGCSKDASDTVAQTGIVKYMPPPDNCNDYMIVIEKEESLDYYKPDNLPNEFKTDELPVKLTFRKTEKIHNCGFAGNVPVINIINIHKL